MHLRIASTYAKVERRNQSGSLVQVVYGFLPVVQPRAAPRRQRIAFFAAIAELQADPVRTGQVELDRALSAMKQSLDAISGQARNVQRMEPLLDSATLAQVVARVNQLVDRLQ